MNSTRGVRRLALASGALAALLAIGTSARAVPVLQLDIGGGFYQDGSIVTTGDSFTVYAYATPSGNTSESDILGTTYYLAIALTPMTGPDDLALGSFDLDGTSVDATGDMMYGVPPLEADLSALTDPGDLQDHGIYETFFYEQAFTFDPTMTSAVYNTQDEAGSGPQAGTGMFYVGFEIDAANLDPSVGLHFDLYSETLRYQAASGSITDIDRDEFAPFSHDAGTVAVPEPSAALVFAAGSLLVGSSIRRRR